jgi:hypothetical protein
MRALYLLAISDKENNKSHASWQVSLSDSGDVEGQGDDGKIILKALEFVGLRTRTRRYSQDRVQCRKWTLAYYAGGALLEKLLINQPVKEFPLKVHRCPYNCPPLDPSRLNPILTSPPPFLHIRLMFSSQSRWGVPRWIFPRGSWITSFL